MAARAQAQPRVEVTRERSLELVVRTRLAGRVWWVAQATRTAETLRGVRSQVVARASVRSVGEEVR